MYTLTDLHKTLTARKRPEDVAEMVIDVLNGEWSNSEYSTVQKAAKGSLRKRLYAYTSMAQEFAEAIGAQRQMDKAIEIFGFQPIQNINPNSAKDIKLFIEQVSALIHKQVGKNNYLGHRLNKFERCR